MRIKTLDQVEATQRKAVRFVRDVLGDDLRADEIEAEDPEDYAERKRIEIIANPHPTQRRNTHMANVPTRADLQERVEELEAENQELQDKLESIGEILDDESEDDDSSEDDSSDE